MIHTQKFQKIRHKTDVNFEGAYISAIRRAKNKSNGCFCGPSLNRGPDANKKNEIRSTQSRDISSLNLGGGQLKSNVQYIQKMSKKFRSPRRRYAAKYVSAHSGQ